MHSFIDIYHWVSRKGRQTLRAAFCMCTIDAIDGGEDQLSKTLSDSLGAFVIREGERSRSFTTDAEIIIVARFQDSAEPDCAQRLSIWVYISEDFI